MIVRLYTNAYGWVVSGVPTCLYCSHFFIVEKYVIENIMLEVQNHLFRTETGLIRLKTCLNFFLCATTVPPSSEKKSAFLGGIGKAE